MKIFSRMLLMAAAVLLIPLAGCNGDGDDGDGGLANNAIIPVPKEITQGAKTPCLSDDDTEFKFRVLVALAPGDAEPAFQATSSDTTKVTVVSTPSSTSRIPEGNSFQAVFRFSCNTRGTEAQITITDPSGRFLPATVRVVCLTALTLDSDAAKGLTTLRLGRPVRIFPTIDLAKKDVEIRSFLSDESAGKFQVTPGVDATNSLGQSDFTVRCVEPGATGSVNFTVRDPTANPFVQTLSCPLQCRGGK